ncbi:tail fiber domain-containing protein [Microbacterium sp. CR_7]|uniref:tail fiber domain-containing protein n=1 Tax=Microbacterium sp. CR_7 TaxID=3055792 RepID=UPI0035C09BB1
MPESYTGSEGTLAAQNGIAVMDGNEDRRNGWLAINKTRDWIVTKANAALAAAKTYTDQKVGAISLAWTNITGKPTHFSSRSDIVTRPPGTGGTVEDALNSTFNLAASKIGSDGGTITGQLNMPNLGPVSNSYVAMYRNGDGRVGISPSARKFKKDIADRTYTLDDLRRIRVVEYRLRSWVFGDADAPLDVGVIAEELIDAGLSEFVVFDADDKPLSVHYERLALVTIGALQDLADGVDLLTQRIEALEAR